MTDISSLGYVRVRATDLDAWRTFALDTIGFAEGAGPESGALHLRTDERHARIVLLPGEEDRVEAVGWEVRDHLALQRVQSAVEAAGVATKPLSLKDAETRRIETGIAFQTPGGTPLEVFHGPALDHSPIATKFGNRFVAGKLGTGHVVVPVGDLEGDYRFYTEALGFLPRGAFRLPAPPEFGPIRLRFMGVNARHHSLAIMPTPDLRAPALVHIMVECETRRWAGTPTTRWSPSTCAPPAAGTSRSAATGCSSTSPPTPPRRSPPTATGVTSGTSADRESARPSTSALTRTPTFARQAGQEVPSAS
jgi:3,4-dihydroxy-9,10-secoandrosta-1,3,5(10)-triene-9,17-dione 4,5-dioxygenase